jgi:hypothetical protein
MAHEFEKWLIIKELTASVDHRLPKQVTIIRKGQSGHWWRGRPGGSEYQATVFVRGPKEIPADNPDRMDDLRKVIDLKKSQDVEGLEVTPHMASLLVQVYDQLSDVGKKKFAGVPLKRLVEAGRK